MHPRSTHIPTQAQLVFPLLQLAHEQGGVVRSKDAYTVLAERHAVADDVRRETIVVDCGQRHNLWERHVRFAKERAKHAGYMRSTSPGTWELTDEGVEAVKRAETAVTVRLVVDGNDQPLGAQVELCVGLPTVHTLHRGDARDMGWIKSGEVPLIVTSVPYFDLKQYESAEGQLAEICSYDEFVDAMTDAMRECYRVLMPGGRMALNVGNVLRSRAKFGTHEVLPLSADLTVGCRKIGFNVLTGILWKKMQNCRYENGAGGILGQPGMPRMVIKSESEDILLFKKPGPNYHATAEQRDASRISKENWQKWVRPVWNDVPGVKATKGHPAPYPVEIPFRLISMMSYTGPEPHTVLDPFWGSGTTTIAAMRARRNSAGVEIGKGYVSAGLDLIAEEARRIRDEALACAA